MELTYIRQLFNPDPNHPFSIPISPTISQRAQDKTRRERDKARILALDEYTRGAQLIDQHLPFFDSPEYTAYRKSSYKGKPPEGWESVIIGFVELTTNYCKPMLPSSSPPACDCEAESSDML